METKKTIKFEPLTVDEIDFRVQSISDKGYATILAYKDARVDMNRLDETFGVGYWQKKFEVVKGNLFCSVGVYNSELKEWVWLQDVGVESNTEKQKGEASDSFKRACFNLGIGRELYDYPFIMVKLNPEEYERKADGKMKQTYNLKLKEWIWDIQFDDNNKVKFLEAKDEKGKVRFSFKRKEKVLTKKQDLESIDLGNDDEQEKIETLEIVEEKLSKANTRDEVIAIYNEYVALYKDDVTKMCTARNEELKKA